MANGVRKVNEYIVRDGRAITMTQDVAPGITQAQWDSIGDGTMYLNPADGNLKYKKRGNLVGIWSNFTPDNIFTAGSLGGNLIGDGTINENHFAQGAVNTAALADRSVTDVKIALQAIKDEHFAVNSLSGTVIKEDSVSGSKITASTLNGSKIVDGSVAGIKLVAGTITNRELGAAAVQSNHIANGAVNSNKILDSAVTTAKINNKAVTSAKIADLAVQTANIGNGAVTGDKLGNLSIQEKHLSNGSVTSAKIAVNGVITNNIADRNVTNAKLADGAITGNKIADGTITANKLEVGLQNSMKNAVVHVGRLATVYGSLAVEDDIRSTRVDKTASITGFKVFNPVFADYAEGFVASEPVEVGDIVEIDIHTCVKKADSRSRKIVGVVSDRYGMCLDADEEELASGAKVAIGLLGKVPVNVSGVVEAGDFIVSSGDGVGVATKTYAPGAIVGKALESKETYGLGQVLCLINPM